MKYEKPEINIKRFDKDDIIMTSGETGAIFDAANTSVNITDAVDVGANLLD